MIFIIKYYFNNLNKMNTNSKKSNISTRGTLMNMIDVNFDIKSCFKELLDNAIGALATVIKIYLDITNCTIYVYDNGQGMNKQGLIKFTMLNDRKEGSTTKQGKFGQGGKLSLAEFSQLKYDSSIITKSDDFDPTKSDPIQSTRIEWANAVATDEYNCIAENASTYNKELWNKFAVNPDQSGTLFAIKCDKNKFKKMVQELTSLHIPNSLPYYLGLTNRKFIATGGQISFEYNSIEIDNEDKLDENICSTEIDSESDQELEESDSCCCVATSATENTDTLWNVQLCETKKILPIVAINPFEGATKFYYANNRIYRHSNGNIKITTLDDENEEYLIEAHHLNFSRTIKPIKPSDLNGYTKLNDLPVTLAIGNWNKNINGEIAPNLLFWERNGVLCITSKIESKNAGDLSERKINENIRGIIDFDSSLDSVMGVTIKKSSESDAFINEAIKNVLKYHIKKFRTTENKLIIAEKEKILLENYNRLKKEKEAAAQAAADALAAQVAAQASQIAADALAAQIAAQADADALAAQVAQAAADALAVQVAQAAADALAVQAAQAAAIESDSNSDSDSDSDSIVNPVPLPPSVIHRVSSDAAPTNKLTVKECITAWSQSNMNKTGLNYIIRKMFIEFEIIKPHAFEYLFNEIEINIKIQTLFLELDARYSNDEYVKFGGEFRNLYNDVCT